MFSESSSRQATDDEGKSRERRGDGVGNSSCIHILQEETIQLAKKGKRLEFLITLQYKGVEIAGYCLPSPLCSAVGT